MSKVVDPWQAESDARTLTEHAQIMSDGKRKSAATKVLKQQQKNIGQSLRLLLGPGLSPTKVTLKEEQWLGRD